VPGEKYTVDSTYTSSSRVDTTDTYGNVTGSWTFSGWTDPNEGIMGTADVKITGSWVYKSETVAQHTVRYTWSGLPTGTKLYKADGMEATPEKPADVTVINGAAHNVDTRYTSTTVYYTHDEFGNVNGSYTFSGWDKSGTLTVTANVEIKGSWVHTGIDVAHWNITYHWTGDVPTGDYVQVLPTDPRSYANNEDYTVDTNYTAQTVIPTYDEFGNHTGDYTFSGWNAKDGNITSDLTIQGVWTKTTFTPDTWHITYEFTGEVPAEKVGKEPTDEKAYTNNESYTVNTDPQETVEITDQYGNVIETYTFQGWDTKDGNITGNLTIHGAWTKTESPAPTWAITYEFTGDVPAEKVGKEPIDEKAYTNNEAYTVNTDPQETVEIKDAHGNVIETYTFQGWDTEDGNITGNLTIHGVWKKDTFTPDTWHITYEFTGEVPAEKIGKEPVDEKAYTNNESYTVNTDPQETVEIKDAHGNVIETYTFQGWDTKDGNITGNLTIHGEWTKATSEPATWHITYEFTGEVPAEKVGKEPIDGKAYTNNESYTVNTDPQETVEIKDAHGNVIETYTFQGWDTKDGNITSDLTIHGEWIRTATPALTWNITYVDGVEEAEVFADDIHNGIINNSPTPAFRGSTEREGYTFAYWTSDIEEGSFQAADIAEKNVTANVTYTAQWTPIDYRLIYDANGGDGAPVDDTAHHIAETVQLNTAQKPVHPAVDGRNVVFIGWTEQMDATIYAKDDAVPALSTEVTFGAGDITVYAVWGYDEDGDNFPDVTERQITFSAESRRWTYNGMAQEFTEYSNTALAQGDRIAALTYSARGTDASEIPYNGAFSGLQIVNSEGTDVTDTYFVTYIPGTLTIDPLPITIQARSDSKIYDGEALTNGGSDLVNGRLADGHTFTATVEGSITYCGSVENVLSNARILDASGNDVTRNYAITYLNGILTVTDGGETPIDNAVVQKTHGNGTTLYGLGDTVTFTITVTNVYNEAKNITLTEREGMILSQSSFQNVAPGASVTATATYTVTEADVLAGTIHNEVIAAFDGGSTFTGEDDVPVQVPVPSLLVEKNVTGTAARYGLGDTVTYSIRVTNNGNVTQTNVRVTDPLTGQSWLVARMEPGDVENFTTSYVVTALDVEHGSVSNTATATGTSPEGYPDPIVTDTETVDTVPPIRTMEIEKTRITATPELGYFTVGQVIDYTIAVTNTGNVNLYNVLVTDELTGLSETIPTLAPGVTETLHTSYEVRGEDAGSAGIVNTAVASVPDGPTVTDTTPPAPVVGVYTLTVNYVFADGTEAAPSVVMLLYGGELYRVKSPAVAGFIANTAFVTGFMPHNAVTWTVVYNAVDDPAAPVVVDTPTGPVATEPNPTGGVELDPTDYTLILVEDEEVPLANMGLDGHTDCALHFILVLAAMVVMMAYTRSMKKHQKKIQELTEELELEKKHRGASDGTDEKE